MLKEVEIQFEHTHGVVVYDTEEKSVKVRFDHWKKAEIENYLKSEREYRVPYSDRYDEDETIYATPIEKEIYFDLAMAELWGNTDVLVNWNTEKVIKS